MAHKWFYCYYCCWMIDPQSPRIPIKKGEHAHLACSLLRELQRTDRVACIGIKGSVIDDLRHYLKIL